MKLNWDQKIILWVLSVKLCCVISATEDYYRILCVAPDASDAEIRQAFRKMALKYHPDKNAQQGSEEHFMKIVKAYDVLSNPRKRKNYDQFGSEHSGPLNVNFQDFFNQFDEQYQQQFGEHSRQNKQEPIDLKSVRGRSFDFYTNTEGGANAKVKVGGIHIGETCRTVLQRVGNMMTSKTICL